jgi:membrane-anchored protein YejM (alkaline phosphatase superfamily)
MADPVSRRTLFRWTGWFAMANAVVLAVIGLAQMGAYPAGGGFLAWIYLLTVSVSHYAMLSLLPLLLLVPVIVLWPRRRLVHILAVLVMAATIALVLLDSLLWSQSHFHINALTVKILGVQSRVFIGTMFLIGLVFETLLAGRIWIWVKRPGSRHGKQLGWLCFVSLLIAQGIYAWSDASYYVPVTRLSQQLPVYSGFTAKRFFAKHGLVDIRQARERQLAARIAGASGTASSNLNYPLSPLSCSNERALNLLVIIVDAMRFDLLNTSAAPRLTAFASEKASRFQQHFSGGNSSRMGMFSFFYGLPPGYFATFEAGQRSPVLLDQFQQQDYQLGLFSSASLSRPVALDRTAFANVPDLRISSEPESDMAWKRDRTMTDDWFNWLAQRDQQRPFFGFLFYDATSVHAPPPGYHPPSLEQSDRSTANELKAYQAAMHYNDSLIGEVLDDLASRGLDRNTVILVSADHGEEFNESGEGFDKHGSGYSHYQLQVPMLLAWPGRTPRSYGHRTSHYDVAPTLVNDLLGCVNPPGEFSSGTNLFSGQGWPWILAGSYYNYAVLEPHQVTVTFPNGLFEVRDRNYHLLETPQFNGEILEAVMRENTRFYRK